MGGLREDFAALAAAGDRTDLALSALAIARIAYPDLDPAPYLRQLDDLAAAVRPRLYPQASPEAAVTELAGYLFGECGFRGNQEEYYDPRNSYLNDVLERRTGIPITLAVVLIETGARLGLGLEGVGFPGHFLVRVAGSPPLLDPFFRGRRPLGAARPRHASRAAPDQVATARPAPGSRTATRFTKISSCRPRVRASATTSACAGACSSRGCRRSRPCNGGRGRRSTTRP